MKKNILIVDDSALMRRVLSDIIEEDDNLTVAGIAGNGKEALELLMGEKEFDAVLLDLNMPKMNGLQLLENMKEKQIQTRVLIVSTIASEGGEETIRALELGAFDFVQKPKSFIQTKSQKFSNMLRELLYCGLQLNEDEKKTGIREIIENQSSIPLATRKVAPAKSVKGTKLIIIACSTGGPKALHEVIPKLREGIDCAVLIVQHMPEGFTKTLANRLNEISALTVKEAEDNEIIQKNVVYVAKGGYQMRVKKQKEGTSQISISQEAARYGLKPCADILFESVIYSDFEEIICVILTGMGADGTRGVQKLLRNKQIHVIAQDEQTSIVYGMPKVIYEAGLTDEIKPLDSIADAIRRKLGVR